MANTIREQIIDSIVDELEDITVANGFNSDMGSNVKRAIRLIDKDNLPAVAVFPLTEDNEPLPGKNNLTMSVRLEALAKFGSVNPSVMAEKLLGDLIKRMTNPTLNAVVGADIAGGLAEKVQYLEGGVDDYPEAGKYTIGVYATFNVNYKTLIGNPYAQS